MKIQPGREEQRVIQPEAIDLGRLAYFQEKMADVTDEDIGAFPARINDNEFRKAFSDSKKEMQKQIVFLADLPRDERNELRTMARAARIPGLHDMNNALQTVEGYDQYKILLHKPPTPVS